MLVMLQFYVQVCFLKVAPQDAPYSKGLFYFGLMSYYLVGVIITSLSQTIVVAVIMSAIQVGLILFLTNLLLWIKKAPERYEQTMSALTITGAVIGLAALPVIALLAGAGVDDQSVASLLWVMLVAWETLVIAHIFRHSLEISFLGGLGISLIYMYLSFAVTLRLMKIIAAPL